MRAEAAAGSSAGVVLATRGSADLGASTRAEVAAGSSAGAARCCADLGCLDAR